MLLPPFLRNSIDGKTPPVVPIVKTCSEAASAVASLITSPLPWEGSPAGEVSSVGWGAAVLADISLVASAVASFTTVRDTSLTLAISSSEGTLLTGRRFRVARLKAKVSGLRARIVPGLRSGSSVVSSDVTSIAVSGGCTGCVMVSGSSLSIGKAVVADSAAGCTCSVMATGASPSVDTSSAAASVVANSCGDAPSSMGFGLSPDISLRCLVRSGSQCKLRAGGGSFCLYHYQKAWEHARTATQVERDMQSPSLLR